MTYAVAKEVKQVGKKNRPEVSHAAFLNGGREYLDAANELLAISDRRPRIGNARALDGPINFLYFQAVELALKAFLRANDVSTDRLITHKLVELYDSCRELGFRMGRDDAAGIGNIVGLLDSGNVDQGFRYFTPKSTNAPDLDWTRDVVGEFVTAMATHIERLKPDSGAKAKIAKATLVWGPPKRR